MSRITSFAVYLFIVLSCPDKGLRASENERKLIRYLLDQSRYDASMRPVEEDAQPVNVTFTLALFQLIGIIEREQKIKVMVWIRQNWKDPNLQWNPADHGNLTTFNVNPDQIWVPDIVLYNNVDESNSEYGGNMDTLLTRPIVYSTGMVHWNAPVLLKGSCRIDVKDFPFDTQHCKFKFGSWTYAMSRLNMFTNGLDSDAFLPSQVWNLVETTAQRNEMKYDCCANRYVDITFHMHFQRRSLFYCLNLIFPIAMLTLLTILAFVLPAESGERMSLAITLMLAVTVFQLLVAETTPDSSESVPLVGVYFITCMIMMFAMIILLCVVSRMYNRGRTDGKMGAWTRRLILDKLSYLLWIRARKKQHGGIDVAAKGQTEENLCKNCSMYSNKSDGMSLTKTRGETSVPDDKRTDFEEIDDDVDEDLTFEEEWRIVAMTVDRLGILTFIFLFLLATTACFSGTTFVA